MIWVLQINYRVQQPERQRRRPEAQMAPLDLARVPERKEEPIRP
jgi:hypothetical protein